MQNHGVGCATCHSFKIGLQVKIEPWGSATGVAFWLSIVAPEDGSGGPEEVVIKNQAVGNAFNRIFTTKGQPSQQHLLLLESDGSAVDARWRKLETAGVDERDRLVYDVARAARAAASTAGAAARQPGSLLQLGTDHITRLLNQGRLRDLDVVLASLAAENLALEYREYLAGAAAEQGQFRQAVLKLQQQGSSGGTNAADGAVVAGVLQKITGLASGVGGGDGAASMTLFANPAAAGAAVPRLDIPAAPTRGCSGWCTLCIDGLDVGSGFDLPTGTTKAVAMRYKRAGEEPKWQVELQGRVSDILSKPSTYARLLTGGEQGKWEAEVGN